MAKKQTRRSVSIRGATYDRIRQYCEHSDISMSEFVEERISKFFSSPAAEAPGPAPVEQRRAPTPSVPTRAPAAKATKPPKKDEEELSFEELHEAARFFTF